MFVLQYNFVVNAVCLGNVGNQTKVEIDEAGSGKNGSLVKSITTNYITFINNI